MISAFRRSITTCASLLQGQRGSRSSRPVQHRMGKRKMVPPRNPGVDHRLKAMRDEGVDMNANPDMDILEDSESDFYNVGSAHRQFEKEEAAHKEMINFKIVKQKYFKEQVPNFLTWSEKEHIRHLHSTDPEEWSPEAIAEAFPTTPEGAQKILDVIWKPASYSRIKRHDDSAMRNWKELKEDTLNGVTPEMKDHIMKFSKRTIPPRQQKAVDDTKELSPGAMGFSEFKNIVTKYDKAVVESTEKPERQHFRLPVANRNDQLQLEGSSELADNSVIRKQLLNDKTLITLDSLRSKISQSSENNVEISLEDQSIITPMNEITSLYNSNEEIQTDSNTYIQKANPNIPVQKQAEEKLVGTSYPDRIRIPKKAYQRGVTYKVNDCYYDDDGRFLYRVPGMEDIVSSKAS